MEAISPTNISSLPLNKHIYPHLKVRQITVSFFLIYFLHRQVKKCPSRRKCVSLYAPLRLWTHWVIQKKEQKINMEGDFISLISAIYSLQKFIFEDDVIELLCLMTLLMHRYQVVPSVFGQMCSLVCLLSINYLYLKFNGSYIYLGICI